MRMTTAQVVETSVTVNNNIPIQDYVHLDDQTQPTFDMILVRRFFSFQGIKTSLFLLSNIAIFLERGMPAYNFSLQEIDQSD